MSVHCVVYRRDISEVVKRGQVLGMNDFFLYMVLTSSQTEALRHVIESINSYRSVSYCPFELVLETGWVLKDVTETIKRSLVRLYGLGSYTIQEISDLATRRAILTPEEKEGHDYQMVIPASSILGAALRIEDDQKSFYSLTERAGAFMDLIKPLKHRLLKGSPLDMIHFFPKGIASNHRYTSLIDTSLSSFWAKTLAGIPSVTDTECPIRSVYPRCRRIYTSFRQLNTMYFTVPPKCYDDEHGWEDRYIVEQLYLR
jgi:hypothetical protein